LPVHLRTPWFDSGTTLLVGPDVSATSYQTNKDTLNIVVRRAGPSNTGLSLLFTLEQHPGSSLPGVKAVAVETTDVGRPQTKDGPSQAGDLYGEVILSNVTWSESHPVKAMKFMLHGTIHGEELVVMGGVMLGND
jgi:hypothetical protein